MSAAISANDVPRTISKASYLPEDLIIMIVDELVLMDTYNIEESCFLNKHWYYCVASYKFKPLNVSTRLNGSPISPHSLKDHLKEGDDLTIDLTRNKIPYEYWEAMNEISRSNMTGQLNEDRLFNDYWGYNNHIPSLDVHERDILLHNLTIIVPGFESKSNSFTYDVKKTECLNLHLISTSEEVSMVSKKMLLKSTCTNLHTTNLLVERTKSDYYQPRQVIVLPMIRVFSMSFTDNYEYIENYYIIEDWMNHLMSILPNLEELHITNLKSEGDWPLNTGGLPQCVFLKDSYPFAIENPKSAKTKVMSLSGDLGVYANLYCMPLKYLATQSFFWIWNCLCVDQGEVPIHDQECTLPLQVLDASGSDWSNVSIRHFRGAWPDLKALNCSNTQIDGDELREFIEEREDSLEEVVALNCPNLSDEVASWIADTVRKTELDSTGRRGYEGEFDYSLLDIRTFLEKC